MAGTVVLVPFGERAFEMLRDAITRAQSVDLFAPVTVIVPTRRAAVSLKGALCSSLSSTSDAVGLVNVHFVVVSDVAELLGSSMAFQSGRVRLTRIALGGAARRAVQSNPGFLESIADHRSTEEHLVEFYESLRDGGDDAVRTLERRGARQRDLAQLCRAMRGLLEQDFFDDVDLARCALEHLRQDDIEALGTVVVHLPSRLRNWEVDLIAALGRLTSCTVHLGTTADQGADELLDSLVALLVGAGFERVGFGERHGAPDEKLLIEVASVPDPRREVDVAMQITTAALEQGVRADQITWSYCTRDPYARLIASAFERSGLAWNGPSPHTLGEAPLARFVIGILDLIIDGSSRTRVMAWFASSPIQDERGQVIPFGEWERISRLAGILDQDLTSWRRRLSFLVDFVNAELKAMASFDESLARLSSGRARRRHANATRTIEATRSLLRFLDSLEAEFRRSDSISTFSAWSLWVARMIGDYLGISRDKPATDSPRATGDVLAVIDELARLDCLEPMCDAVAFRSAFVGALARRAPPVGDLGTGISVGPLESALATDVELLVVLGASEGALPRSFRRSSLLNASDEVAIGLHDRSILGHISGEQRRFLGCLGSAKRRVVLSPARALSGRTTIVRSRFVGEFESLDELALEPAQWDNDTFASESALAVALLAARREHDGGNSSVFLLDNDAELARAVMAIKSHDERRFDAYAGNVGRLSTDLSEEIFSPTTLEAYANCPFRFFLSHELGIEVIEPPEVRMGIDPRSRGALVHAILERFVRAQLPFAPERTGEVASADELEKVALEEFEKIERRGVVGRRPFWERDRRRILEILQSERARDERRRAAGTKPVAVELAFGTADLDPVAIDIGGKTVLFRGKVDRIDRNVLGELDVIDYKTGKVTDYRSIGDDPVDKGRHLQLPIYGLAARGWSASEGATVARSAFRFLDANGQEVDVVLDEKTQRRFKEVLHVLIRSIEAGAFPVHPGAASFGGPKNCRRCDYDALCRNNRSALWQSVRLSDTIRDYAGLVSGEDDE